MRLATSSTEFSINEQMYCQKDGVAMGSPLGPILANIFMGFLEMKYMKDNKKPLLYYRYVDDCFCFSSEQRGVYGNVSQV